MTVFVVLNLVAFAGLVILLARLPRTRFTLSRQILMGLVAGVVFGLFLQFAYAGNPAAIQETLAAFGLPPEPAEAILPYFGVPVTDYDAYLAGLCPGERSSAFAMATDRREAELAGDPARLFPGARDTLEQLRADGHALAICSNGSDLYVNAFLDGNGTRSDATTSIRIGRAYSGTRHAEHASRYDPSGPAGTGNHGSFGGRLSKPLSAPQHVGRATAVAGFQKPSLGDVLGFVGKLTSRGVPPGAPG